MLKCGLYQNKVNLQEKLVKWFAPEKIEFHHFLTLSAIFENPQKLDLDLIVFASGSKDYQVQVQLLRVFKDC